MAKAHDIPELSVELPFREAAALAVGMRAEEVWLHEGRALDTGDIEGVHDMRVATRRLRAVMEIFAPCFPKKRHGRALKDVKRLADALGERRDRDVMVLGLRKVEAALAREDAAGIESLVAELERGQDEANETLERALRDAETDRLRARLALLAAEVRA